MEDQYGPVQVEALAVPVRGCRVCVDRNPARLEMSRSRLEWRTTPVRQRRGLGQRPAIGPEEVRGAVIPKLDSESFFVDGPVVVSAQEDEILELRRTAVRPVAYMVRIAVVAVTPGKPAPLVPVRERAADSRRDGPGLAADVQNGAIQVVAHGDGGGIARHAANRLRGNV